MGAKNEIATSPLAKSLRDCFCSLHGEPDLPGPKNLKCLICGLGLPLGKAHEFSVDPGIYYCCEHIRARQKEFVAAESWQFAYEEPIPAAPRPAAELSITCNFNLPDFAEPIQKLIRTANDVYDMARQDYSAVVNSRIDKVRDMLAAGKSNGSMAGWWSTDEVLEFLDSIGKDEN